MNLVEQAARTLKQACGLTSRSPLVETVRPAYDWWLKTACGDRVERRFGAEPPVYLRAAHRYVDDAYEERVLRRLKPLVRAGDTVLDVGAHIGLFAIVLARWVGPAGRIVAFEPSPAARAALVDHLALNGVGDRVEVKSEAVSEAPGAAEFHMVAVSPESTLNPVHSRLGTAADTIPVAVTSIDAYCRQSDAVPGLIKIDVEGLELRALRGARSTLGRCRPVVLVEMHPMNWPEIGESPASAETLLRSLGCRVEPIEGQDPLRTHGHVLLDWA
jgi:FkbM family methyltransferase